MIPSVKRFSATGLAVSSLLVVMQAACLAQSVSQEEILERLQQLEEKLDSRDARIEQLETELKQLKQERAGAAAAAPAVPGREEVVEGAPMPATPPVEEVVDVAPASPPAGVIVEAAPKPAAPPAEEVAAAPSEQELEAQEPTASDPETWGVYDPGTGFLVGRNKLGQLSISGYAVVRYLNQRDADGRFADHLGRERTIDGRSDIYSHRVIVWLNGWVGDPKLVYTIAFWTVNTTDQDALFGNIGYRFHRMFNLYGGITGNPGSRSMQGSHPFWLGHDRVMADEFFRPFFTQGVWANGEVLPGLWYSASVGNNSSTLGITASQLDREFTYGGSLWWMPTTHEFGPRGAYGDWEMHEEVATRFGISTTYSPEDRYSDVGSDPDNTSLRLADSVNLFETGALADGVTITSADYYILAVDAGLKYRGIFLQAEYFNRWLNDFATDGFVPVNQIEDHGFYVQSAFYPIPRRVELYAATSQIFGDRDEGFRSSSDYIGGLNYYPFNTRNHRVNVQYIYVNRSPVSSSFGYYTGGQVGSTVSVAASVFF